ncbi:hypothetical protein PHYPO_G00190080 [Pangasianodon hypophthalmus]|uniref:C-type lectin domain-containing protein n=1 Tax=Pangasianodon hypophthalmus TaxID=310915 RepID=A0A5N5PJK4_PANHP|nr:lactose-binding lectin l-2 isoform X1 [Pangasianodon hypophthalmus]XP_053089482.1 lactose-binding lectin l-2 isoform X1 [Pangasianodon hypophthalmus]KAB5579037.1 hypothetical protein PHYPO_G00190080 [Pangasianodon hypophthalmus]
MAHQTDVVLLLILAIAATAFANVVKPLTAADFDKIVQESAGRRQAKSRCFGCCPFGWVFYGGSCFTYQASSMDWISAEKYCLNLNAHLVSMRNENEYQLVKALIRAHDPQEKPTWIGLSGCQKRNNWLWSDGTKLTFTKWNPTEPNFKNEECCVLINFDGRKDWVDAPCEWTYHFVCATKPI